MSSWDFCSVQLAFPKYTPPEIEQLDIERLDTIKWPYVQNESPFSKHHLYHFGISKCSFWRLFFSSLKFDWQTLSSQEQFRALGQDENVEPNGAPFFGRKKREPLMEEVGMSIRPYLVKKRRVLLLYYVKLCV